jgi:hypothetical protein
MKFNNLFKFLCGLYLGILIAGAGILWSALLMSTVGGLLASSQYAWVAVVLLLVPSGIIVALMGVSFMALAFKDL